MLLDLVTQSCQTLCDPMDYSLPGSFVHGDSPGKNTRVGCQALLGDLPNAGIEPRSPELQADSFFFFFSIIYLNWRLITLQYYGFCHTVFMPLTSCATSFL